MELCREFGSFAELFDDDFPLAVVDVIDIVICNVPVTYAPL